MGGLWSRAGALRADARGGARRLPRRGAPRRRARRTPLAAIEARATVDVDRIAEIEATTDHDVIAFVSQVAETVGPEGRYLHLGLTSSDVVDTALALQLRAAGELPARRRRPAHRRRSSPGRAPRPARVMMGRTHSRPRGAHDVRAQVRRLGVRGRPRPGAARRGDGGDRDRQDQRPGRDVQPPRPGPRGRGARASSGCASTR